MTAERLVRQRRPRIAAASARLPSAAAATRATAARYSSTSAGGRGGSRRDLGLLGYHAADVAHERLAAVALDVAADVPGRVAGLVGQAAD